MMLMIQNSRNSFRISVDAMSKRCLNYKSLLNFVRPLDPVLCGISVRRMNQLIRNEDPVFKSIKRSTSPDEVFKFVGSRKPQPFPVVLHSLRTLLELQRKSLTSAPEIRSHPGFELLCQQLRTTSRSTEFNDIVEVIKILSILGVSPNSGIYHIYLNLAKKEINSATLMQIVFLDFVLEKVDSRRAPLVDALRMSFPILFQMHISTQIDHENITQLITYLAFISRTRINRKSAMVVLNALLLHGTSFTAGEAQRIAWSLCDDVNPCSEQRERLFQNTMDCLTTNIYALDVEIIENTVSKMAKKFARHPTMYHERFLQETANYLIKYDVGLVRSCYFLKSFNRLSFVHPKLGLYLLSMVKEDPSQLENCRPTTILSLFGMLSNANFRQNMVDFKDSVVPALMKNSLFDSDLIEFPWTKLACDLSVLDMWDSKLTNRILNVEFLTLYLARESTIDYLQLLSFYQSVLLEDRSNIRDLKVLEPVLERARDIVLRKVDFPLKTVLELAFGGQEYVGTKIITQDHQLIDHVLQFNENKDICKLNLNRHVDGACHLEDLQQASPPRQLVAVMGLPKSYFTNLGTVKGSFDFQMKTMARQGLILVTVNLEVWNRLPDHEKIPYLQREVKSVL